ncbi:VOC family protein [Micropruina sp.]|uniref:VOC family protein n=1 Tax=Micropruina sp. TaxID=2737536 RepID=UPI0039E6F388
MTTEAPAALAMVTIDCADPSKEAEFWAAALGWEVTYADDNYGMASDGTLRLGFGRVEDWQRPEWPNPAGTKQFHLDLAVDDLDAAEEQLLGLGATKPTDQPGDTWTVLLDPDGHPFCLTKAANWS